MLGERGDGVAERFWTLLGFAEGGGMSERMPLCVMLEVMRLRMAAKDYDRAMAAAKVAAPYVHGKVLAARVGGGLAGVPDDELEEYGRAGGDSAEAEDPEAVD